MNAMEEQERDRPVPSFGRRVFGAILFALGGGLTLLYSGAGLWKSPETLDWFFAQPFLVALGMILTIAGFWNLLRG